LQILVVEDNRADFVMLRLAVSRAGIDCDLVALRDGQEALEFIEARAGTAELPNHILLDLKTPRRTGLELLAWIRAHAPAAHMRVIVLTSSTLDSERTEAERLGIDAYLQKLDSIQGYISLVQQIAALWNLPLRNAA